MGCHSEAGLIAEESAFSPRPRTTRPKGFVPHRLAPFLRDWECFDPDTGKDSAREIREFIPTSATGTSTTHTRNIQSPDCPSEIIRLQNQVAQNAPHTSFTPFPKRPLGIFPILEAIRFL